MLSPNSAIALALSSTDLKITSFIAGASAARNEAAKPEIKTPRDAAAMSFARTRRRGTLIAKVICEPPLKIELRAIKHRRLRCQPNGRKRRALDLWQRIQ